MPEAEDITLPAELEKQFQELVRGAVEVLPTNEFRRKLLEAYQSGRPLRVKAGFDPTAPDLHLGHTVLLQKMRQFQKFGHHVLFLIGDYTAMIGDPTGKSETRKPLSRAEVEQNAQTYREQVFKILDPQKTEVVFNSKWLAPLQLEDILRLTANYTVARMLERDDFSARYRAGQPISLVEFMYPLLQGYDSVALQADIELGGSDQKFNLLVGRDLQVAYGQKPQCLLLMPLLVGLDGKKKMSKSLGNYIGIQEPPSEIYGKLMSISDDLMLEYYELLSDRSVEELAKLKEDLQRGMLHPKEAKAALALEITARFSSEREAQEVAAEWQRIHNPKARGIPTELPCVEYKSGENLLQVVRSAGFAPSNSEARRMIEQGAIYRIGEDGSEEPLTDYKLALSGDWILRAGKRRFVRLKCVS
ncbi:MAG: tyrosine--tRNA ligase [Turneriella sp.]|nr:tyrosine--tRNA ligase [Leptospiraceae bacterium]MCX7632160.1 tyrosine--tRNA ligase [Turneriella sp.]